ncbi:MAG: SPOR domain-containing protein [Pseudomonadota bacterium]
MPLDSPRAVPKLASANLGNTLIGFIIGLVVGLSVAVAVALAITKGSTPFTDKSGKLGKLPEPTAGQISDPNKPLYGSKDAAREANKEFQKEPTDPAAMAAKTAAAATAAPAGAAPADPKLAKPAAPAPAAGAAAAAAPAAPAAAPAKPDAPAEVTYFLQTGAFREVADAESARAKLALLGFEASISDRTDNSTVLHRVRLGPYTQVEAMNKVRTKLSENGIEVAVMRNPK